MPTLIEKESSLLPPGERDKAVRILAKSIFRELKTNGYTSRQIVALSSELIGLVTRDMRAEPVR